MFLALIFKNTINLVMIYKTNVSILSTGNQFMPQRPLKGTLANSVDPDQTPHHNAASDQGLHCLHYIQDFL